MQEPQVVNAKLKNTQQTPRAHLLSEKNLPEPYVSPNALTVLQERYLAKDDKGVVYETPKQMYIRVAEAIASIEKNSEIAKEWALEFYYAMAKNEFLPNSPTLMNAGRRLGMLSACFVIPVEDDLDGIFDSVKATALVQRAGGGTGFNFSNLRPSGSIVKSSGGTTAGPLSFIDVFSQATNTIQQGAFRRGANMGILNVDHPDIISFIKAKSDLKRWQNYNISIAMTDAFMDDIGSNPNKHHKVHHKEWGTGFLYKNDATGEVVAFQDNKSHPSEFTKWTIGDTWSLICKRAWETGEPGLFFIDKANKNSPVPHLGRIVATNPCGEQNLHAFDSCNLGSINLAKCVDLKDGKATFNIDTFKEIIRVAVRFLDNVIEANNYPLDEIREMSHNTRRIGLGVMGFADLLFDLKIPYDSPEALAVANEISKILYEESTNYSIELGHEKGSYGAYKGSTDEKLGRPMRNAYRTTVAPTGTISIIAGCSSGIEPIFALAFKRTVMPDDKGKFKEMWEENQYLKDALDNLVKKFPDQKSTAERVLNYARSNGNIKNYTTCAGDRSKEIDRIQEIFVTSHDIAPINHVKMQAEWQKHIDTAISKTINLNHNAEVKEVMDAYWEAYLSDCKGITVYRDGCRNNVAGMKQPMSVEKELKDIVDTENATTSIVKESKAHVRPNVSSALRTQVKTQFGNLHVILVYNSQGQPTELFAQLGKAGDLIAADMEGMCRLASKALCAGVSIEDVCAQLEGIGTTHIHHAQDGKIVSMPDALCRGIRKILSKDSQELSKRMDEGNIVKVPQKNRKDSAESDYGIKCPSCSIGKLVFQEGCQKCHSCGYSAC